MSEKNNDRPHAGRRTDAAPSSHARTLKELRAKLLAAGLSEGRLIAWLKERRAVPDGIFALRSISARKLEILVAQWSEILPQLLP
jgi:hypothetical protein